MTSFGCSTHRVKIMLWTLYYQLYTPLGGWEWDFRKMEWWLVPVPWWDGLTEKVVQESSNTICKVPRSGKWYQTKESCRSPVFLLLLWFMGPQFTWHFSWNFKLTWLASRLFWLLETHIQSIPAIYLCMRTKQLSRSTSLQVFLHYHYFSFCFFTWQGPMLFKCSIHVCNLE